jgi:hypothetical protein
MTSKFVHSLKQLGTARIACLFPVFVISIDVNELPGYLYLHRNSNENLANFIYLYLLTE